MHLAVGARTVSPSIRATTRRVCQQPRHFIASLTPHCPIASSSASASVAVPPTPQRRHIEKCHSLSSEWLGPNFPTLHENVPGLQGVRWDERGSMPVANCGRRILRRAETKRAQKTGPCAGTGAARRQLHIDASGEAGIH